MTTYFDWDTVEDNIVEEFDDAGATTADYTTEPFLYGDLVSQRRSGQSSYFHYDALGSTLVVTDESQNVSATRSYAAFGEVTESTGSTEFPFQYIGGRGYYKDPSELVVFVIRRRNYDPQRTRWLTPDPATAGYGLDGDYLYVANSPCGLVDPSGLFSLASLNNSDSSESSCDEEVKRFKVRLCETLDVQRLEFPEAPEGAVFPCERGLCDLKGFRGYECIETTSATFCVKCACTEHTSTEFSASDACCVPDAKGGLPLDTICGAGIGPRGPLGRRQVRCVCKKPVKDV